MPQRWSGLKPYLRVVILVAILVFLGQTFRNHTQEVTAIRIDRPGWAWLAISLGITLLAHIWAGWVWGWILQELEQPVDGGWATQTYLKTNIAKYLPSNLLHLYGRTVAATAVGVPLGAATLSVLLEALLLAAAALITALSTTGEAGSGQLLGLGAVLIAIHPRLLNLVIQGLIRFKSQRNPRDNSTRLEPPTWSIKRYPLRPLLGELGFLGLRSGGFVLSVAALTPVSSQAVPLLVGAFSIGWLLGFITPGAPGGLGVFEVTVLTLLKSSQAGQDFSPGLALSAVALYRLVSTLAEAIGAGLAWLDERL